MATLAVLDQRLQVAASRLEESLQLLVSDIGSELAQDLIPATPVDTGRARANWRPSLNIPATRPVTAVDPTGAATIARITAVARQWQLGDTFYLVNRVSYIDNLNDGSSSQAEAGFVQASVTRSINAGVLAFRLRGI